MNNLLLNPNVAAFSCAGTAARHRVKKPLMLALAALAFAAPAFPAFAATQWWSPTPQQQIGQNATVNVQSKGAKGDGVHNDTAAIQAAIDSLPATGGTVTVPAGRYMVDATKSIRMRSHTRLLLDSNATLVVIPNNVTRSRLIRVWNVTDARIVGGSMEGDRAKHIGHTGEWGMGIDIIAARNVVVKGTRLSEFWGDGIYIGASGRGDHLHVSDNVTIVNVVSNHNRRQGLSITPATHVYVVNSTFSNTQGTAPQGGVDIEPQDQGKADTIRLERNTMSGNRGNGIELHANISGITITNNQLSSNHGFGVLAVSAPYLTISGNHATRNGLAGVGLTGKTHNSAVRSNTLQYNSTIYMSPTHKGGGTSRDIQIASKAYAITNVNNQLTPRR